MEACAQAASYLYALVKDNHIRDKLGTINDRAEMIVLSSARWMDHGAQVCFDEALGVTIRVTKQEGKTIEVEFTLEKMGGEKVLSGSISGTIMSIKMLKRVYNSKR